MRKRTNIDQLAKILHDQGFRKPRLTTMHPDPQSETPAVFALAIFLTVVLKCLIRNNLGSIRCVLAHSIRETTIIGKPGCRQLYISWI